MGKKGKTLELEIVNEHVFKVKEINGRRYWAGCTLFMHYVCLNFHHLGGKRAIREVLTRQSLARKLIKENNFHCFGRLNGLK